MLNWYKRESCNSWNQWATKIFQVLMSGLQIHKKRD